MTDVISMSVATVKSVAYSFISFRFAPGIGEEERAMSKTDTGVQITRRELISSMKSPRLGRTTATLVMTSGWSTNELISWLVTVNIWL